MTVQQLKYILKVAEVGSITEAAKLLFISQPSLSNSIKETEKEAGITIFLRSRTGITLTKDGAEFLGYCSSGDTADGTAGGSVCYKSSGESDIWSIFSALYFYGKRFCGVS